MSRAEAQQLIAEVAGLHQAHGGDLQASLNQAKPKGVPWKTWSAMTHDALAAAGLATPTYQTRGAARAAGECVCSWDCRCTKKQPQGG